MIFIPDSLVALYEIDVQYCRYRERDETRGGTWVYDRLMGLTSEDVAHHLIARGERGGVE